MGGLYWQDAAMPVLAVRITEIGPTMALVESLRVHAWSPLSMDILSSEEVDHAHIDLEAHIKEKYLCEPSS